MINNEYDKINIPKNIDMNIESGVKRALLEKAKLNKKKKIKSIGVVVASLIAVLTLGISNPVLAAKIPLLGNVFKAIEKTIHNPGNYSKFATSINETVYSNGISVTLSEALCDGQSLYVTYIVKSEESFKTEKGKDLKDTTQLGVLGKYNKVDFSKEKLDNSGVSGIEGKFVNENTFVGVEKFNLSYLKAEVPNNFEFHTKIDLIENYALDSENPERCKFGSWKFKIPVTVNKGLRRVIDLTGKDVESKVAKINSISLTPFEMRLDVDYKVGNWNDYRLFIFDENGEMLQSYSKVENKNNIDTEKTVVEVPNSESKSIRIVLAKDFEGKSSEFYTKSNKNIVFDKTVSIK